MAVYLWLCPDCDLRMYLHEKEHHNCATGHLLREAEHLAKRQRGQTRGAIELAYLRGERAGRGARRNRRKNKRG